jgi:DNA processing protein
MVEKYFRVPLARKPSTAASLSRVSDPADVEQAVLVALLRTRPGGLTWQQLVSEIIDSGSAIVVWEKLYQPSLFDEVDPVDAPPVAEAARDIAGWRAAGLHFRTFRDEDYPAQLREIHQLPPVLFGLGKLLPDDRAVAVVGSRRATPASLRWAHDIAEALVDADITVASGLAAGIDTAAHLAALEAGGRTVAIIGTGINRAYPQENERLQRRIAADGLVLSQFWPDAPPTKASFPMRNATMSGYGRGTIIVEAAETSGARIQARLAVEHGRPVILRDAVLATEWAMKLRKRPGVHVTSSIDETMEVVRETSRGLDEFLGDLVPDVLT